MAKHMCMGIHLFWIMNGGKNERFEKTIWQVFLWQAWFLEVQQFRHRCMRQRQRMHRKITGYDVEITLDDKPYLALGADLTADQQHTVLSYMGIEAADFDKYDVVYVSNAEEHQYLDSYIPKKQIGTKALSSVLVSLADSGNGLKVSTYNINYCTAGMYKNALATAGVEDANVIVAGPFPLSGTAALVGTFEAYEKLTGKELDESVVDAAMDELVTTGDLEQSIDGDSNDVEAMIADLKGQIASGKIKTPEEIEQAIEKLADKYDLKLSDDDKQKLLGLMKKPAGTGPELGFH